MHSGTPVAMMSPNWVHQSAQSPGQLLEYWQVIRGNFLVICILGLIGAGVGWVVTMIRPSMYQARTVLDIRSLNEDFLNQNAGTPMGTSGTVLPESYLQTEIKILDSESIRKDAIQQLIKQKQPAGVKPTPATGWRAALGVLDPANIPIDALISDAGQRVKVRALGNTRIVDMLCQARDAQIAADVCNGIAHTYIQHNADSRLENTKETGEWLSSQLHDVKARLTSAESELQSTARETSLLPSSEAETLAQDKLRKLQEALSVAQQTRMNKESEYEIAVDGLPLALDGRVRDYRMRLNDLKRQVAELSATMTPQHYKVRELTGQIVELEASLKKEQATMINGLRADYETALRQEAMLQQAYDKQTTVVGRRGDKAVHYDMLRREVDSERKIYDTLLQRVQEVGLVAALRTSTISIVDAATPPVKPYSPDMLASVGIGFIGGSCLGLAFSFVRRKSDRTLQNPGDAAFHLQLRELGVIPNVRIPGFRFLLDRARPRTAIKQVTSVPADQVINAKLPADPPRTAPRRNPANSIALGTWLRNPPELAEAYHSAMNSVLFASGGGRHSRVLVLTSPEPGDGKTTAATNLAIALAEIGKRVVLVDGDLRKPRLDKIFGIECRGGLAKLLDEAETPDEQPLSEFVHASHVENLFVLPTSAAREGITTKLHSSRLRSLIDVLRQEFDVVIIDSPPMLHLSDARVLGWLADGVLLVFRSRRTTRESALAAADCLSQDGIRVFGTILNDWSPRKGSPYGAYAGMAS
jgi:capsular exopolysaccharide synthesis family protein